ncbi:MAG: hypothetical protein JWM80_2906 [Cyanobacteria bacterium RYN_339]|nr:hypothetical protein [Cyanobacteria bacterium RYN_339]
MPEWPKGSDCKSDGSAFEGSNPSPPTISKEAGFQVLPGPAFLSSVGACIPCAYLWPNLRYARAGLGGFLLVAMKRRRTREKRPTLSDVSGQLGSRTASPGRSGRRLARTDWDRTADYGGQEGPDVRPGLSLATSKAPSRAFYGSERRPVRKGRRGANYWASGRYWNAATYPHSSPPTSTALRDVSGRRGFGQGRKVGELGHGVGGEVERDAGRVSGEHRGSFARSPR